MRARVVAHGKCDLVHTNLIFMAGPRQKNVVQVAHRLCSKEEDLECRYLALVLERVVFPENGSGTGKVEVGSGQWAVGRTSNSHGYH